ncbi:MAG TPA: GGDEF domain-containing protein, partial [Xanthomonadaceae bacterium]|nr:GGDEF domain-containing protein [Xanthomonadaceae bacterium]
DGSLWIGTNEAGLWHLAGQRAATRLDPPGAGMHKSVWAIHGDARTLWIGTFSAGLYRIDRRSGVSSRITEQDGLSNNVVYRILEDGQGRLWLSTNNGISIYDPATAIHQKLGRRDGLHNQEFNSSASFVDRQGQLYFGGTQGLDVLAPLQLPRRSSPARPVLTGLHVLSGDGRSGARGLSNGDIVYSDRIALPREDTVFTLDMTAVDFLAPAAAQLRYRVQGLHEGWIYPHQARVEFSLNHLPAGHYLLEVQAAGRDGQFGASRRLHIDVPPPLWRHPLAYAAYLLLVALAAWLLVRRVRATMRREREQIELLNHTVAERTAQLRSANQQLLQSNAQLEIATRTDPLTRVSNRRELQDWLARECPHLLALIEAGQPQERLFFFMADIDDFKRVNDSYGHQTGDELLVACAARLRLLCRDRDLLVRWGGEEFLLVARLAQDEDAARLAERMRASIADLPMPLDNGAALETTCSIGFAAWPLSTQWPALGDWEQSIALADRCLYAAKHAGKNAWVGVVAGPHPDRQVILSLLSGADPLQLDASVRCVHSTAVPPRFAR